MRSAYMALLRLYPAPWRQEFGSEMAAVFEQAQADCRARGALDYCAFLFAELTGLIAGACSAWREGYLVRPRGRLVVSYWISIAAGVAITILFQGAFYSGIGQAHLFQTQRQDLPIVTPEYFVPLLLAGGILLLISVFSIAFVWNMRIVGNRSGRLNPIWMPPAANRRISGQRARRGYRK